MSDPDFIIARNGKQYGFRSTHVGSKRFHYVESMHGRALCGQVATHWDEPGATVCQACNAEAGRR